MLSNALISSLMFTVLLRKASAVDIFPEVPSIPSSRETTSDPAVLYEGNEEGPLHDRRHLAAARPPDRYVVVNGIKHRLKSLGEDLELDTPTSSPVSDGSEGDMQAVGGQHPKRDLAPSEVGGRQVINGNPYDLLPSGNCTDPRAATVRFADGSEIDLCPIDPPAHSKRWFRHPHVHDRQTYHGTEFELVPLHTCPARPHAEIEFEEGSIFDLCPVDERPYELGYQDPRIASHAWGNDGQIYKTKLDLKFLQKISPANSAAMVFEDGTTESGGGLRLESPCHKMKKSKKLVVAAWKPGWVDDKLMVYQDDECLNKIWSTTKKGMWWFNATDVSVTVQSWKMD